MSYCCPNHDPLLRVGWLCCNTCGRVAFSTDAAWLDSQQRTVIASFPYICKHNPASRRGSSTSRTCPRSRWTGTSTGRVAAAPVRAAPTRSQDPAAARSGTWVARTGQQGRKGKRR